MYHHMSSFRVLFVALCVAVFAAGGLVVGAERSSAAGQLGIEQGILVLVGDVQPDQALELAATQHAAGSALKVFVQCDRADKADAIAALPRLPDCTANGYSWPKRRWSGSGWPTTWPMR